MNKATVLRIFAIRLKKLRTFHNLTTRVLGEIIGTSHVTITRYETGKRAPDLLVVYKLAKYFNVTIEYLCGDTTTAVETFIDSYARLSNQDKEEAMKYVTYLEEKDGLYYGK